MSFLVTRLWIPVPSRPLISTPCSEAILRTSGDDRWRIRSSNDVTVPPSPVDASSGEGRGEGAAAAGAAGIGAEGFAAACGGGAGGAAPSFSAGPSGLLEAAGT